MPAFFDKLIAVLKRDMLTAARYRAGIWMNLAALVVEIAGFFFLARAVGPDYRPEGLASFPFVLVGTAFYGFLIMGATGFVQSVREAQLTGTMEVMMTSSTAPAATIALTAVSSFFRGTVHLVATLIVGAVVFGVRFQHVNLLGFLLILALSQAVALSVGMTAAALQIGIQRGGSLIWLFSSVTWLATGTLFPVSALPLPLMRLSKLIPFTVSLDGLRLALLKGGSAAAMVQPVLVLAAWAAFLVPASLAIFAWSLRRARLEGTLSLY